MIRKTLALLFSFVLVSSLAFAAKPESPKEPVLSVKVEGPLTSDPFNRDDIADAFLGLFWNEFSWDRYQGSLREDRIGDQPLPRLEIQILSWRTTMGGDILCRISAQVLTKDGATSLGVIEGRTSSIMRSSARGFLGRDFERAGEEASRELLKVLVEKKVLVKETKK